MKWLLLVWLAQNAVLAPSGILAQPAKFDRQNVTALGTAENIAVHATGANAVFTSFQLCDSQCVNVINFGPPKIANGETTTVSGTFYTFFSRGPVRAKNIIVVGGT